MRIRGLDWTEISVVRNRRIRGVVGADSIGLNTWFPVPWWWLLKRIACFMDRGRRGG